MESETLFSKIEQIEDPRKKRGVRHPFHAILKLVILGYVCRLVWIEHMAVYSKKHWDKIKVVLGFTRDYSPNATTIRRAIEGVDRQQLEEAFEEWVCSGPGLRCAMIEGGERERPPKSDSVIGVDRRDDCPRVAQQGHRGE